MKSTEFFWIEEKKGETLWIKQNWLDRLLGKPIMLSKNDIDERFKIHKSR